MEIITMWMTKVLLLLFVIHKIQASPSGAPSVACETLTPNHFGAEPQTSEAPYTVSVSSTEIEKGGYVEVTIRGNAYSDTFRGFLVQARTDPNNYTVIGTMPTEQSQFGQPLFCQNPADTITHFINDDKHHASFNWTSPVDFDGTVYFTASIVRNRTTFWVKETSVPVHVGDVVHNN